METPLDLDAIQGKVRLLATHTLALSVSVSLIAEAVISEDDMHRASLIERIESDLRESQERLGEFMRSLY